MSEDEAGPRLRLGVVPGVNPGRWADTWRGRHRDVPLDLLPLDAVRAEEALLSGEVDAAFLRLPLRSPDLVRIPLWTEETVVAMSRESELTLLDSLAPTDLVGETLVVPVDDVLHWADAPGEPFAGLRPLTTADALDLVAHEAGVCVLPKAIARELHRRDVELRPLVADAASDDDAPAVPASQIALAWLPLETGEPAELVEQLIGIVRGRTVNSTRGKTPAPSASTGSQQQRTPARTARPRLASARGRQPGRRKR
ncbi:MAG: LysR family transcriptional regulator substrate-binding protein [Salana multivorans]|uniref:LysR family transcriptional regulator substrate-binding protein n=1 Tax=Salana multivorans TaxID=120377 RepID=UPI0009622722|nr:LysR family transcriptional regulator substrate-binding protein [Salana multivorans]MBN8880965.1 LysR family transcriptional regulator substrate-binding protein [Salana multivorans]OJX94453.1 MAG: hypothetical protein BGO96_16450 [Micrococcales bacterium 73-15]